MWLQWHWTAQQVGAQTVHPADQRAAGPSRINKQLRICRLICCHYSSEQTTAVCTERQLIQAFYKIERRFTTVTLCVCVCVCVCVKLHNIHLSVREKNLLFHLYSPQLQ